MKKEKEKFNLSYESDGKMGKQEKKTNGSEQKAKDEKGFFNTTQSSE